ncbi:WG repeat-containing protein [Olivibacter sp. LS-1]|nr:WG repeat-containing protein [Olivibacter sp. LS-1]
MLSFTLMKYTSILVLICTMLCSVSSAQEQRKIFYFLSPDSLLGVKDSQGNIIIPAIHYFLPIAYDDFSLPIQDSIIMLVPKRSHHLKDPKPYGLAYDRNGKVLYAPYLFDNGPDYLEEGLSRYVENNKIGFVNRYGEKIIKAQWDWVSPFEYGIARACNGCTIDYSQDTEHPRLDMSNASTFYIDKKGRILQALPEKSSEQDQAIDRVYLPYQFSYNPFEAKLIKKLDSQALISKAYFANYYNRLTEREKNLHFEIVEKPSKGFPYYVINAFRYDANGSYHRIDNPDLLFYATGSGDVYQVPYGNLAEKMSLKEWLSNYDAAARRYLKEHPDAPNRYQ